MKPKFARLLVILSSLTLLMCYPSAANAYTDEIGLIADDVWAGLQQMFKDAGIRKQNQVDWYMESDWFYDSVRRGHGFLKDVMKQTYDRRYRFKVRLDEKAFSTGITIQGVFQERRRTEGMGLSWKKNQPDSKDYLLERNLFFQLLEELTKQRLASKPL